MRKLSLAVILCLSIAGLTACGGPDAERTQVKKELADFNAKCKANPKDAECVKAAELGKPSGSE